MTAINVIRQSTAVHVITDGSFLDAGGLLDGVGSKAAPIAHLNLIVAVRGARALLPVLVAFLESAGTSYDELKCGVVDRMRAYCAPARAVWEANFGESGADFDLIIAGLSAATGPDSYFVTSHDRHGVEPWTLVPLGAAALVPGDAELHAEFFPDDRAVEAFDPVEGGLRLIERQRAVRVPSGKSQTPHFVVGGFAQLTTISSAGIATRIIRRWPDVLGARRGVSPSAQAFDAAPLSRKENRTVRALLGGTSMDSNGQPWRPC